MGEEKRAENKKEEKTGKKKIGDVGEKGEMCEKREKSIEKRQGKIKQQIAMEQRKTNERKG